MKVIYNFLIGFTAAVLAFTAILILVSVILWDVEILKIPSEWRACLVISFIVGTMFSISKAVY